MKSLVLALLLCTSACAAEPCLCGPSCDCGPGCRCGFVAEPLTYHQGHDASCLNRMPFVVFVGQPVVQIPGCICVSVVQYDGCISKRIVVGLPKGDRIFEAGTALNVKDVTSLAFPQTYDLRGGLQGANPYEGLFFGGGCANGQCGGGRRR